MIFPVLISYLAKMTLISAIFFAYYRLFLRDSTRHVYNRRYLLGTILLALLIPLLRLPLPASWAETVTHFLPQPGQAAPDPTNAAKTGPPSAGWREPNLLSLYYIVAYAGIVLLFFWPLFRSLRYRSRLSRHSISEQMPGFRLYQTREPGTPFSFFHHLFWNEAIPIDTPKGQAILRHELVHIHQKTPLLFFTNSKTHSHDPSNLPATGTAPSIGRISPYRLIVLRLRTWPRP